MATWFIVALLVPFALNELDKFGGKLNYLRRALKRRR